MVEQGEVVEGKLGWRGDKGERKMGKRRTIALLVGSVTGDIVEVAGFNVSTTLCMCVGTKAWHYEYV